MARRLLTLLPLCTLLLLGAAPKRGAVAPAEPAAPVTLTGGAQVRFVLKYPACDIRMSGQGPLPVGLIGLDRRQVAALLGQDVISDFSPDLLVLERQLPGCPVDSVTLAVRQGMVVVLAGPRGALNGPAQETGIAVRSLTRENAHRVEQGWTVPSADLESTLRTLRQS